MFNTTNPQSLDQRSFTCPVCNGIPLMKDTDGKKLPPGVLAHGTVVDICTFCKQTGKIQYLPFVNTKINRDMPVTLTLHSCGNVVLPDLPLDNLDAFLRAVNNIWFLGFRQDIVIPCPKDDGFFPHYRYIQARAFNGTVPMGVIDMCYWDQKACQATLFTSRLFMEEGQLFDQRNMKIKIPEDILKNEVGSFLVIPNLPPQPLRRCDCIE